MNINSASNRLAPVMHRLSMNLRLSSGRADRVFMCQLAHSFGRERRAEKVVDRVTNALWNG